MPVGQHVLWICVAPRPATVDVVLWSMPMRLCVVVPANRIAGHPKLVPLVPIIELRWMVFEVNKDHKGLTRLTKSCPQAGAYHYCVTYFSIEC